MEALTVKQDQNQMKSLDLNVLNIMRNGKYQAATLSQCSVDSYRLTGEQFNRFVEKNNLSVNAESIKLFLHSQGWKEATINLKRQAIINLLSNQKNITGNYLLIAAIKENMKKEVRRVKIDKSIKEKEYLTEAEIIHLKKFCDQKTALMIQFLFETGCRISELINIKLVNVKLNGQAEIKIVGKGSKQRTVYAKRELIETIIKVFKSEKFLFETRNGTQYNRINLTIKIRKIGDRAGFINIHAHTIRHSTAMFLKSKGSNIDYVQKYLGHSTPLITLQHYYHGNPGEEITELFN